MVTITCQKEQEQEILNWLIATDTQMFGDVVRCGFDAEANGHPGIFSFFSTMSGITADSGESDEFFYEGHAMCWELKEFYRKLKEAFPNVGLDGYVIVTDKYPEAFRVIASTGSKEIIMEDLEPWD